MIGSGYAQIIGPLVPWRVTEANLRIGNEIYARWLGCQPKLALVNEQAYSAGLVGLYLDAGYRGILMDWDNCAAHHPEWSVETRYSVQHARGSDGRSIGLLWTNTVAFQKLQRLAHGDISQHDYLNYVRRQCGDADRLFCLYASDAEVFGFRPGRYRSEELLESSEWQRIAHAFAALLDEPGCVLVRPSEALLGSTGVKSLQLESAACPVPVKKQRKYNLSRWAVTGRDDIGINAACQRIYSGLLARDARRRAMEGALPSMVERFPHPHHGKALGCLLRTAASGGSAPASPFRFAAFAAHHLPRERGRKDECVDGRPFLPRLRGRCRA